MTIESALTSINERAKQASPGVWKVFMESEGSAVIRTDSGKPGEDKVPVVRPGDRDPIQAAVDLYFTARARTDIPTLIYALRKALKPHQPDYADADDGLFCPTCTDPEDEERFAPWPCETVRNVALALGETE